MALRKTDFPDGFSSSNTPAVVTIIGFKNEPFNIQASDLLAGYITLSAFPEQASTVQGSWNGTVQYEGSTRDFTMSGNKLYFSATLLSLMDVGDLFNVFYQ